MKIAVIDIGSNSVRYATIQNAHAVTKKQLKSTVLAHNLSISGLLDSAHMKETANAVCGFVNQAKAAGADKTYVFATEAVRSAKNGTDFTKMVYDMCGINIDVISGQAEALIGFMGCTAVDKQSDCAYGVVDIGGASAEVICGNNQSIAYSLSLPIGMIRLRDAVNYDLGTITDYCKAAVAKYGETPIIDRLVGIGGTATALASMILGQTQYNPFEIDGYKFSLNQLTQLTARIFSLESTHDIIDMFPTLTQNRASIIGYGAVLLSQIMKKLQKTEIYISERDNMEGYILYKNNV